MVRALLVRGLLAGLVGGILAFAFAWVAAEPAVGAAISYETQQAAAAGMRTGPALVSRDVQSTFGLLTALLAFGLALGGLFALVFAALYGRLEHASPSRAARRLGAAGFVVVYLVPFLKYPANPPGAGLPETIGTRTALYVAMLVISVAAAAAALWLRWRLARGLGAADATLAGVGCYLAIVLVTGMLLPSVNEVPAGFPAVTLWNFRLGSIGIQAVIWTAIAIVFGQLAERVLDGVRDGSMVRR